MCQQIFNKILFKVTGYFHLGNQSTIPNSLQIPNKLLGHLSHANRSILHYTFLSFSSLQVSHADREYPVIKLSMEKRLGQITCNRSPGMRRSFYFVFCVIFFSLNAISFEQDHHTQSISNRIQKKLSIQNRERFYEHI